MENTALAWAAITSGIIGPVSAVIITLLWEKNRRSFEIKMTTLQNLLLTRGRYADPLYTASIRTIPIVFATIPEIKQKHENFLNSTRVEVTDGNRELVTNEMSRREGILISAIMKNVGLKGLSSEEIETYTSSGLNYRDQLFEHALMSLPLIARNSQRSLDILEVASSSSTDTTD